MVDNKERVYFDGIGGRYAEVRILGTNVTSDDEGCGTNSMKVYFAFFTEDNDRDDVDGPSATDVEME